jgi:hypothetical protein
VALYISGEAGRADALSRFTDMLPAIEKTCGSWVRRRERARLRRGGNGCACS